MEERTDWRIRLDDMLGKYKISDGLRDDLTKILSTPDVSQIPHFLAKNGKFTFRANYAFRHQCPDFKPSTVTASQVFYTNVRMSYKRFIGLMETGEILYVTK